MRLGLVLITLLALGAGSCSNAPTAKQKQTPHTVILVSMDGFRPDYLDRGKTPVLKKLANEGTRAQWMTPSYPALTFPNHYTLVTGLRPDNHGIVHNTMQDKVLGNFALKNREAVADGRWWGGEPIWVTAEKQGLKSATMFWPGSEAEIAGLRPNYWLPYNKDTSAETRVDTVLGWLDLPAGQRPNFITLYFEYADDAGHYFGTTSPELDAALVRLDTAIIRLLAGLEQRGLRDKTNLVVVSDHGMIDTHEKQVVIIDNLLPVDSIDIITQGQALGIAPKPGKTELVEAALLKRHGHFTCWRRENVPAALHYGKNPRIPPIVCQADDGWSVLTKARFEAGHSRFNDGEHGFDPRSKEMRALFMANGPDIKTGKVIGPIENVDVYDMLCNLLGIKPVANDGDGKTLKSAIAKKRR